MSTAPNPLQAAPTVDPQVHQFAAKIRTKFPGAYDDLDDTTLASKVVAKHPEYSDMLPQGFAASQQPGAYQTGPGAPIQNSRPNAQVSDEGVLEAPDEEESADEGGGASSSPQSFADRHPYLTTAASLLQELGLQPQMMGAVKGAAGTGYNLASLASRGVHALNPSLSVAAGVPTLPAQKPSALEPQGFQEKAGNLAEQVGEFYVPEGLVGKGVDAAEAGMKALGAGRKLTTAGSLLAEMGLEGAATGAVTGAQGGNVEQGAELGAAAPAVGKLTEPLYTSVAPGIANRLIKPRDVQFSFGKNPGEAVAKVGITKDMPSLVSKLQDLKSTTGSAIDAVLSQPKYANATIDLKPLVEQPIDDAIQSALSKPMGAGKQDLIDGLLEMKNDFLNERALDQNGQLVNAAPRNLSLNPFEATKFKRDVGDSTRWTGSAFDKDMNQVRRGIYSNVRQAVEGVAPEVAPLNEDYGNALEAQTAASRRMHAGERNNPFSLTDLIGGATGSLASAAMGSGLLEDAIVGVGASGLSKLARSTLGRTAGMAALKGASSPAVPRGAKNIFLGAQGNRLLGDADDSDEQ